MIRLHDALAKARAQRDENDKGFTLIELLVVVLIIGILAAIAIPVFIGQQQTAQDGAAKSDLANAKTAVIAYAAANNGAYTDDEAALVNYGYVSSSSVSANVTTVTIPATGPAFRITRISDSGATFCISSTTNAPVSGSTC